MSGALWLCIGSWVAALAVIGLSWRRPSWTLIVLAALLWVIGLAGFLAQVMQ